MPMAWPRDHPRRRRGEEQAEVGDLRRLDEPLDGLTLEVLALHHGGGHAAATGFGVDDGLHPLAGHRTRADGVAAHIVRSQLDGERLGEPDDRPLRRCIGRAAAVPEHARHRRHVDDRATPLPLHHRRHSTSTEELGLEPDRQARPPLLEADLLHERRRTLGAGIVDQHVDSAEVADGDRQPGVDRLGVGEVDPGGGDERRRVTASLQRLLVHVAQVHPCALANEGVGHHATDATGSCSDDDSLVPTLASDVTLLLTTIRADGRGPRRPPPR